MICPQTKAECGWAECVERQRCACYPTPTLTVSNSPGAVFLGGGASHDLSTTLAEIERLVETLIDEEVTYYCEGVNHEPVNAARAALMAAIQRHIQE